MKYLDPKADLTFKKVFGTHPDLVISLLNALLPLEEGKEIESVEYLTPEMAPRTPTRKNSIVDVRCKDSEGRHFIVEMQMVWSTEYKRRVVFNAAKAYVGQLNKGEDYDLLQPVYSLNLVNDVFENDVEDYYHYYRMVHDRYTNKVIEGLNLIFVELPKFHPQTMTEKKMTALWLRFLTEIGEKTREVPQELLADPSVKRAIEIIEESAFTDEELEVYDMFWDAVSVEKTWNNAIDRRYKNGIEEGREQGMKEGMEKGLEKGLEEGKRKGLEEGKKKGLEEGDRQRALADAKRMKDLNLDISIIQHVTGLSAEDLKEL